MRVDLVLVVTLACGCATSSDSRSGAPGGKWDDPCTQAFENWLLTDYAPLTCEDGPSCIGRVPLTTRPKCDGAPTFGTWITVYSKHMVTPWFLRHNASTSAFELRDSPEFENHDAFVAAIAPTVEERRAHEAMMAVPSHADAFDYTDWLGQYVVLLDKVAFPLQSQTNLFELDGRRVCGDPFLVVEIEPEPLPCPYEPALMLDGSEQAFLAMFEAARPRVQQEGVLSPFGDWSKEYYDYLTPSSTDDRLHFAFPMYSNQGLTQSELAFYERLRSIRPDSTGDADSANWLGWYETLLFAADLAYSDQVLRLDLYEASKPTQLVGHKAYQTWLGLDVLELGYAALSSDAGKLERFMRVKPCARDADELAAFQVTFAAAALDAQAAPTMCK